MVTARAGGRGGLAGALRGREEGARARARAGGRGGRPAPRGRWAVRLQALARTLAPGEREALRSAVVLGFSRCGGFLLGYRVSRRGAYSLLVWELRLGGVAGVLLGPARELRLFQAEGEWAEGVQEEGCRLGYVVTVCDVGGLLVAHARPDLRSDRARDSSSVVNHMTAVPAWDLWAGGRAAALCTHFTYETTYPHPQFDAEICALERAGGFLVLNAGSEIHRLRLTVVPRGDAGLREEGGPWEAPAEAGELLCNPYSYPSDTDEDLGSEGGELGGPRGGAGETSEASTGWQSRLRLFTHLEAPAGGGALPEWALDLSELRPWNAERSVLRLGRPYFRGKRYLLHDYDVSIIATHGGRGDERVQLVCLVVLALSDSFLSTPRLVALVLSLESGRSVPDVLSRGDLGIQWQKPHIALQYCPPGTGFWGGFVPTTRAAPENWHPKSWLRDPRNLRLVTADCLVRLRSRFLNSAASRNPPMFLSTASGPRRPLVHPFLPFVVFPVLGGWVR